MEPDEVEGAVGPVFPLAKQVAAALEGAVYPLTRRELVLVARFNEAPKTLLSILEGIPDARFRSLDEVQVAVSVPAPPPEPAARSSSGRAAR
ncbi:MAG TPA: DUF2795 domain-containing protein [Myxococcaceae bacterium]|jgi:hypothetical protein